MRILLANKFWRPAGGVEVHQQEVARFLENRGHEVVPFAMREQDTTPSEYESYFPSEVEFRAGTPSDALRSLNRAVISRDTVQNLKRLVVEQDIEAAYVLHVYHQLGMSVLNTLKKMSVPTILSIHDYKIGCPNYRLFSESTGKICTKCVDSKLGAVWNPAAERCWDGNAKAGMALSIEAVGTKLRRSYQKPDVITTLNSIQENLVQKYAPGVKFLRLPHPVPLKEPRSSSHRNAFIYVGRLVPEKGVELLIRASAETGLPVKIIGDGRSREALEEQARVTNAPVEFMGELPHDQVETLMRDSIALVVPSTWHEVSPLVVYEAIANDVPVIASAVGGMVDQLGDGRGYLVADFQADGITRAMREVADDQILAQERSENARRYATENWSESMWQAGVIRAFEMSGVAI